MADGQVFIYEPDEEGRKLVSSCVEDCITEFHLHPDGTMELLSIVYLG